MKQYLLFAGRDDANAKGVHGLIGGFDSVAEAFVALVDQQSPCEWWHVLDTRTGEVVDRRHLKFTNGMVAFQRSDWLVGMPPRSEAAATVPALPISLPVSKPLDSKSLDMKSLELSGFEAGLRSTVANGVKHARANGQGAAADH